MLRDLTAEGRSRMRSLQAKVMRSRRRRDPKREAKDAETRTRQATTCNRNRSHFARRPWGSCTMPHMSHASPGRARVAWSPLMAPGLGLALALALAVGVTRPARADDESALGKQR